MGKTAAAVIAAAPVLLPRLAWAHHFMDDQR